MSLGGVNRFRFGPAAPDEDIVYGACRPGRIGASGAEAVDEWITFMQTQGIERVCCLLAEPPDDSPRLLGAYREAFGPECVCHAPITDYSFVDPELLQETILPFLRTAAARAEPVVVHCSAGSGRTGQILVAWLVCERNYSFLDALATVRQQGRTPTEAGDHRQLRARIADCE